MFRYKGPTDQPILLIDDVSTTGVTIGAARAALQSAGHTGVVLAVVWAQAV
jgi:predicted amidophosphoribosyltransferase